MRWTQFLIPTLKETPADAEIVSHQLLLRAGLIRKLTSGLYTFLPAGLRALRKVEQIVREEMDRAGALEVLMPALQPPEIWVKSGRYETARDVFFRARDRANREWILGPTHEEVIAALVSDEISSYRQLPKNFYQIQTKFRDELRPRFGLMRAREFVMKDAYSFDSSDEAAQLSYRKMYDAYARIFHRCGLKTMAVEADTGVMGGQFSHEYMVPAATGENEVIRCPQCGYAANQEKAESFPAPPPEKVPSLSGPEPLEKFATPGVLTIEALAAAPYGVEPARQIKTLIYVIESKPALILLRGSDQLNEAKLVQPAGTGNFRPATPDEIFSALKAHAGSLGAVGVSDLPIYADFDLQRAEGMTTGANEDGFHLRHVSVPRDIAVQKWAHLRLVQGGDGCPRCQRPLEACRAIEVGHLFKLGTKYSEKLGACFLTETGQKLPAIMCSYGIGITRTLQAVIEQSHDAAGIIWPPSVAPFMVCITPLPAGAGSRVFDVSEAFYRELTGRGVETILDDRDERPGIKFKDSELVGFPLRVTVGEKSVARDEVEIKPRAGPMFTVKIGDAVARIVEWVEKAQAEGRSVPA